LTMRGAPTSRQFRAFALVIVVVGTLMLVVSRSQAGHDEDDPGDFSAFTRHQLRTNWTKTELFPLLVPLRLPAGATSSDAPGFALDNVVVDTATAPSRRVWVSYYESDALGQGVSVRIFQRPADTSTTRPCGPVKDQFHIERNISGAIVTICSNDLERNEKARRYWKTTTFTDDLGRVRWLEG
jgi:hypothetical protein